MARLARLVVVPRIGRARSRRRPPRRCCRARAAASLGAPGQMGPRPRARCSSRRRHCPSPPPRSGGGHGRAGASRTGCPTASSDISAGTICIVRSTDERAERRDRRPGGRPRGARKECARRGRARPAGTIGDRRLLPRLQRAIDDAGRHDHRRRASPCAPSAPAARQRGERLALLDYATSSSTCFEATRAFYAPIGSGRRAPTHRRRLSRRGQFTSPYVATRSPARSAMQKYAGQSGPSCLVWLATCSLPN